MTKSFEIVQEAFALRDDGWNLSEISRALGVNRATLREWLAHSVDHYSGRLIRAAHVPEECELIDAVPWSAYSYLLGQYLGDGCISQMRRGVFRLRISTCDDYPGIRQMCGEAIAAVMPNNRVGFFQSVGCGEVSGYSKHWPCLLPQHGAGAKHDRAIELAPWQVKIVEARPHEFVKGLIHSDGWRGTNNVTVRGKQYCYPRYLFTNTSKDILMLCAWGFDLLGVEWRQNNWNSLSVAKRDSVALLDTFIGPKS